MSDELAGRVQKTTQSGSSGGTSSSVTVTGSVAVTAAALPLPAGASTEATLAAIKAKTDNLDVALSTRTKPSDTQPVSVSGSVAVTGAFYQATQPVSGTFWQATQPVSGSVSVSGTFFQATQPVSAAALPLPAGASTETTLALIKAKTDNLDVLLSTRTKPGDTQPVSGTFWQATQPVSGSVSVSNLPATQPVSAAALPLPSGAATAGNQTLQLTQLQTLNSLVPGVYDYVSLGYTGTDLTSVVFKAGGASGTTVSTLTLAYTASVLQSVTKT